MQEKLANTLVARYWCNGKLVWERTVHTPINNKGVDRTLNVIFGQENDRHATNSR